jgi:rhodanese-related sulfurtransferase
MKEIIVDVREYLEYVQGHIEGAKPVPLASLHWVSSAYPPSQPILLVCKSGRRAEQARQSLAQKGFQSLSVLPGGMDAWRAAGRPVVVTKHQPWTLERQVRTMAGSLILITLTLAYTLSSYFLLGTAFIGAGLIFAGASNTCLMASMLGRMPWNRAPRET